MQQGRTHRVCPSCGAVSTSERVTCDYCGTLTARKPAADTMATTPRPRSFVAV
jgi:hypothetical protein